MDQNRVLVKLDGPESQAWAGDVSRWFADVHVPTKLHEMLGAPKAPAKKSLAEGWSKFRGGDVSTVLRWLKKYSVELEELSGVSVESMSQRWMDLVAGDSGKGEAPISPLLPRLKGRHFFLRDALGAEKPQTELLGWHSSKRSLEWTPSRQPGVRTEAWLWWIDARRRLLLDLQAGSEDISNDPPRVVWCLPQASIDRPVVRVLCELLREHGQADDEVRVGEEVWIARAGAPEPAVVVAATAQVPAHAELGRVGEVPWAPARPTFGSGEKAPRVLLVKLEPMNDAEAVGGWLESVGAAFSPEGVARVRSRLVDPWRGGEIGLPGPLLERSALEGLVRELADGRIPGDGAVDAVAAQRAWTGRRARALFGRVSAPDQRMVVERHAAAWAAAWLRNAGSLSVGMSDGELAGVLSVPEPGGPVRPDLVPALIRQLLHPEPERVRGLLNELHPNIEVFTLLQTLEEIGVFRREGDRLSPCDPALWLELASEAVKPEDVAALCPHLEGRQALALAVLLSDHEEGFSREALGLPSPLRRWACCAVLEGVSLRRHAKATDARPSADLLTRLWAVAVWDTLHAPGDLDDPSTAWGSARWRGRSLVDVSRSLRAQLPRLAGQDPHASLLALVPPEVVEETLAWRGLPGPALMDPDADPDRYRRCVDELDRSGARSRLASGGAACSALWLLCPWQLSPVEHGAWVVDGLDEVVAAVALDQARAGDPIARAAMTSPSVGGRIGWALRFTGVLPTWTERVRWAAEGCGDLQAVEDALAGAEEAAVAAQIDANPDAAQGPDPWLENLGLPVEVLTAAARRMPSSALRWWLFGLGWEDHGHHAEELHGSFGERPRFFRARRIPPPFAVALAHALGERVVLAAWTEAPTWAVRLRDRDRIWQPLVAAPPADLSHPQTTAAQPPVEVDPSAWWLRHLATIALFQLGEPGPIRAVTLTAAGGVASFTFARRQAYRRALERVMGAALPVEHAWQLGGEHHAMRLVSDTAWGMLAPALRGRISELSPLGWDEASPVGARGGLPLLDLAGDHPGLRVIAVAGNAHWLWGRRGTEDGEVALRALVGHLDLQAEDFFVSEPVAFVDARLRFLLAERDSATLDALACVWSASTRHERSVGDLACVAYSDAWFGRSEPMSRSLLGKVLDPGAWWERSTRNRSDDVSPLAQESRWPWDHKPLLEAPSGEKKDQSVPFGAWLAPLLAARPHGRLVGWVIAARDGWHGTDSNDRAALVADGIWDRLTPRSQKAFLTRHNQALSGSRWTSRAGNLLRLSDLRSFLRTSGTAEEKARVWAAYLATIHDAGERLKVGFDDHRPWTRSDAVDAQDVLHAVDPDALETMENPTESLYAVAVVVGTRRRRGPLVGLDDRRLDQWLVRAAPYIQGLGRFGALGELFERVDELAIAGVAGLEEGMWTGRYPVESARAAREISRRPDAMLLDDALGDSKTADAEASWRELVRRHSGTELIAMLARRPDWREQGGEAVPSDRFWFSWAHLLRHDPETVRNWVVQRAARFPNARRELGRWVLDLVENAWRPSLDHGKLRRLAAEWVRGLRPTDPAGAPMPRGGSGRKAR